MTVSSTKFNKFSYKSLEELIADCKEFDLNLPFSKELGVLKKPVCINGRTIPNSIGIHPMEGNDGKRDGSPGELTLRRYMRFAESGAGLIWFEAVAVAPEGRAIPYQLWIRPQNVDEFKSIRETIDRIAADCAKSGETGEVSTKHNPMEEAEGSVLNAGKAAEPLCIMQLTHSGRFCKPDGKPAPIIAYHNPYLNQRLNLEPEYPVITDGELERLEEKFEEAAVLAKEAGFDGVDVKCCHRYLNCELLSAYIREGKYGGSFEGRTRFLLNVVDRIRGRLGKNFIVATRLNVYDGIPYPYGWGVDKEDYHLYDLTEPLKLIGILQQKGVGLINITMGTPYYNAHVNRPYDIGHYIPDEHPLTGVARLVNGAGEIKKTYPDMVVVGTGYSWLRHFAPYLAAGCIKEGMVDIAAFGREAFAYPQFASDILQNGRMEEKKCCISCSKCADILRAGGHAGCVIKDAKVYAPIYKEFCMGKGS